MNAAKANVKPFIEHVRELQIRLTWCAASIGVGGFFAYLVHPRLMELIRRPLGQTLYYTSPVGGFNFVFKLCLVAGIIVALPVIIYHCFRFVGPMIKSDSKKLIISFVIWSFVLAVAGVLFGYLISLPAALHFLTAIGGENIKSLIQADEYFNFALAYIAGFALIFQVPVVMLFINKIRPLSPGPMMRMQRYIILASFILAAILTPTPDPVNQAIMALPMVILYQVGVVLVWLVNKKTNRTANNASLRPAPLSGPHQIIAEQATDLASVASNNPKPGTASLQPRRHTRRQIIDITPANRQKGNSLTANERSPVIGKPHNVRPHLAKDQPHLIDMILS